MSELTKGLTYEYLNANYAPTREERIEVCHAFCGSCGELRTGMGNGCAKNAYRKFSQSGGCQLMLALGILNSFGNVVTIVHSPLGCASNSLGTAGLRKTMRASKNKPSDDFVWLHTNLDEVDVISGGLPKLERAILYAEKEYRPDAIIVANGCVPGIIGDDIDTLINELNAKVSAKIVPIHCEGFKSRYVMSGYDSAYHGVLKKLVDPPERYERSIPDEGRDIAERIRNSRTVNVFNVGSNSYGDEVELGRLIKALDLIPRFVPLHAGIDEISRISEAALNVSICATHDDYLLGHLKERFGVPYMIGTLPIGIKNTGEWLREIGARFGLEKQAERIADIEAAKLEEALVPFRKSLAGKRLFVGGGETRIFTTGEFFQHLGLEIVGLKPHNFDRFALPFLEEGNMSQAVISVAPGQPAEELNILSRLRPDFYIGHSGANAWVAKLGIPNMPLFGQAFNYMGYSGAFELARKADKIIKNTSFVKKVSENIPLPFKPSWYDEDPYDNIKQA